MKDQAYYSRGFTADLTSALSKVTALHVVTVPGRRQISQVVPATEKVLTGGILKTQSGLRVQARLTKAADDSIIWAGTFNRSLADVFAIQDEIARTVLKKLGAPWTSQAPLIRVRTKDPVVYLRLISDVRQPARPQ